MSGAVGSKLGALACTAMLLGSCSLLFSAGETGTDAGGRLDAATIDAGPIIDAPLPDAAPPLSVERLILRYYLDEDPGEAPFLRDIEQNPVDNLELVDDLEVTGTEGRRGLRWESPNSLGGATATLVPEHALLGLKALHTLTFELVLRVDAAGAGLQAPSTLFAFTTGAAKADNHALQIQQMGPDGDYLVEFVFNSAVAQSWQAPTLGERSVLHFGFDSTQLDAVNRVSLYSNGTLVPPTGQFPLVDRNATLKVDENTVFTLGNAPPPQQPSSIGGKLFYLAIYDAVLSEIVMGYNAAILISNDDQPPPMP